MVSATVPTAVTLGFFCTGAGNFSLASQLSSRGREDPVPDPLLL
jgi:hypothetical protein